MKLSGPALFPVLAAAWILAPPGMAAQDERDAGELEGIRPPVGIDFSWHLPNRLAPREEPDWDAIREDLEHVRREERPDPVEYLRWIEAVVHIEGADDEAKEAFKRGLAYARHTLAEDGDNGELHFAIGRGCHAYASLFEEFGVLPIALEAYAAAFELGESEVECTRRAVSIIFGRAVSTAGEDEDFDELTMEWVERALAVDDEAYMALNLVMQLRLQRTVREMLLDRDTPADPATVGEALFDLREEIFELGADLDDQLYVSCAVQLFSSGMLAGAVMTSAERLDGELAGSAEAVEGELEDGLEVLLQVLDEGDYGDLLRSEVAHCAWLVARVLQHPDEPEIFERALDEALEEGGVLGWKIAVEGLFDPEALDHTLIEDYLDERDDEYGHIVAGFGAFQLGDFELAVSEYREAADEGGESWRTWFGLGLSLLRAGLDPEEALEALERAEGDVEGDRWEERLEIVMDEARRRIERGERDDGHAEPAPLSSCSWYCRR